MPPQSMGKAKETEQPPKEYGMERKKGHPERTPPCHTAL